MSSPLQFAAYTKSRDALIDGPLRSKKDIEDAMSFACCHKTDTVKDNHGGQKEQEVIDMSDAASARSDTA